MRYLLLIVTPREDGQETWTPHWFEAANIDEAYYAAKQLAFSAYEKSTIPLDGYRFELVRADSILPTMHSNAWLVEYLLSKKT